MTRPPSTTLHAPTRRTLTRAAAWTVPAIAAASAAPSFAVTLDPCAVFTVGSTTCSNQSDLGRVSFQITTTAPLPVGTVFSVVPSPGSPATTEQLTVGSSAITTGSACFAPGNTSAPWTTTSLIPSSTTLAFRMDPAWKRNARTVFTLVATLSEGSCPLGSYTVRAEDNSNGKLICGA